MSMNQRIVPYILRLTWKGRPLRHTKETGWAFVNENGELVQLPHEKKAGTIWWNPGR